MIRKDAASLFRIAVAEAPRAPKLGAIFYAQGPGTTPKRLAQRAAARMGAHVRASDQMFREAIQAATSARPMIRPLAGGRIGSLALD